MNSLSSNLSIGTAQLGLNYGSFKKRKKISNKEFKKIIKLCIKKKIFSIDTAVNYGDSEEKIGKALSNYKLKFDLTTKIPSLKKTRTEDINNNIVQTLRSSEKKLKSKINTILLHDVSDLKSKKKNKIYTSLNKLKKMKIVKNIGFSAYNLEEVKSILKEFNFDVVQVPFNVFDQRLIDKKFLKVLKKNKTKIYIRSIFLQGLLIDYKKKNKITKRYFNNFNKWHKFLKSKKLKPIEACIIFVKKYRFYSKILIGFDDFNQLNEILLYFNRSKNYNIDFKSLKSNDLSLINPINWKQ